MRLSEAKDTVEAKADGLIHDTTQSARHAAEGLSELTDAIVQDGRDGASRVAKAVQRGSDAAVTAFRDNVKAQPSLMIGLAASAGLILGLVLAARR